MLTGMKGSVWDAYQVSVLRYCQENLVRLVAYLPSPYVKTFLTAEETTYTTLISNLGGMLGLCMGLSFVSVAEIFFFISKYFLKGFLMSKK